MFRKIIYASIGPAVILALILAVGGGVYLTTSSRTQVAGQKLKTISHEPIDKEPLTKLVYVGTNETFSEALYNLDLQDGKLDEPHIVHKIKGFYDSGEIKEQSLEFINIRGKLIKSLQFTNNYGKEAANIFISRNTRYALVQKILVYDSKKKVENTYFNIDGKILWKRENLLEFYMSPTGKYIVYPDQKDKKVVYLLEWNGEKKLLLNLNDELKKDEGYTLRGAVFSRDGFFTLVFSNDKKKLIYVFEPDYQKYSRVTLNKSQFFVYKGVEKVETISRKKGYFLKSLSLLFPYIIDDLSNSIFSTNPNESSQNYTHISAYTLIDAFKTVHIKTMKYGELVYFANDPGYSLESVFIFGKVSTSAKYVYQIQAEDKNGSMAYFDGTYIFEVDNIPPSLIGSMKVIPSRRLITMENQKTSIAFQSKEDLYSVGINIVDAMNHDKKIVTGLGWSPSLKQGERFTVNWDGAGHYPDGAYRFEVVMTDLAGNIKMVFSEPIVIKKGK